LRDKEAFAANVTLAAAFAKLAPAELLGAPQPAAPPPPAPAPDAQPPCADAAAAAAAAAELAALPRLSLSAERQAMLLPHVVKLADACGAALELEHASLLAAERENARAVESRGEVGDAAAAAYERLKRSFELLLRGASALAEALGREPPSYPEDAVTRLAAGAPGGEVGRLDALGAAGAASDGGPFEDEEQRAFYESLPELRAMLPAVLLGGAERDAAPGDAATEPAEPAEPAAAPQAEAEDDAAGARGGDGGAALGALLARLPACVTRDACDAFSLDFCYLNGRGARRRLVRELASRSIEAQRLPYVCRIAATLATVMRDVGPPLVAAAEDEAAALRGRRDGAPGALEARIRNASLVCELTKFRLAPPGLALGMLKACLDDFSGGAVDCAAALLEGAGRFLSRAPESAVRANALLDALARLKLARNLDSRQAALLEAAYAAARPPARASLRRRKERPPEHEFVRHVVFRLLGPASVERCVRLLRRLPWSAANEAYLLKTCLKVHKARHAALAPTAALLAGLSRQHESLGCAAVDDVLEALRDGLEANALQAQQRRVAQARLLGELYNHRLMNGETLFGALYLVLTYGYEPAAPGGEPPPPPAMGAPPPPCWPACDPPDDCFRVRLLVTLLSTCGGSFDRGAGRARLDRFLIYFQRYVLSKPALPIDQAFDVADLLAQLRPRGRRFEAFEEAAEACAQLEAAEAAAAARAAAAAAAGGMAALPEEPGSDEEEEEEEEDEDEGADEDSDAADAAASDEEMEEVDGFEEEENFSDEQDEQEEEEEEEDEDDEDCMRGSLVPVAEQEAFERELASFLGEAGGSAQRVMGVRPMPRAYPTPPARSARGAGSARADVGETVSFKMLTRRDGRARARELRVPVASEMATTVAAQQEAEEAERSELKRLVLGQVALSDAAAADADAAAPGRVLFSTSSARGGERWRRRQQGS
jgi:regulator of nonsense transcripts 2